jgi:hypothetical protein
MKNPNREIRALVYSTLSAALTTPIYNAVLKATQPPYIFIGSQTFNEASLKDTKAGNHTLTIDVVTRFTDDYGGDKQANDITSDMQEALAGLDGQSTDNFKIITHNIETSDMLYATDGAGRIVRQITTIRNFVQEY